MYLFIKPTSLPLWQNAITGEDILFCRNSGVQGENLGGNLPLQGNNLYIHDPQPRIYILATASDQNNNVPNR